ncbi:MAG: hypothetical protein WAR59_07845 [Ignavibacteriaceae bacterium]
MKKKNLISVLSVAVLMAVLFSSSVFAQDNQTKVKTKGFVDANQDGYNDIAPDADGDGIPNGRDEDYTGSKIRKNGKGFVDLNGDGINDNAFDSDGDGIPNGQDPDFVRPQDGSGQKKMNGKNSNAGGNKYGPGNGNGNNGVGPKDGTGNGSGNGTGTCDGTGSKGRGGRK